jgi:hypothetical protein
MGIGPFESFSFPGVYVQTLTQAPLASVAGDIRFPAFIGTASNTVEIDNFEMIRGSSAMADNPIVKLDVSAQFISGLNRNFNVAVAGGPIPIVNGDGSGTVTNNPAAVTVYINGAPVPVASVNGTTGDVYLVSFPALGDVVQVSYFFKNKDDFHANENLSDQADGVNKIFQTHFYPIVQGDNGGTPTTDPSKVIVTVNSTTVTVSSVAGVDGQITLAAAPALGATVLVSYYSNEFANTADYLPSPYLNEILEVGLAPGSSDFVQGKDFILDSTGAFKTIQWGDSFKVATGTTTVGFTPFYNGSGASASIVGTLYDNRVWRQNTTTLAGDSTNDGTNKTFVMPFIPMNGQGRGYVTENPSSLLVYVGTSVSASALVDSTIVTTVDAATKTFQLQYAPAVGQRVFVTEYNNILTTDAWTLTDTTVGGDSSGGYTVVGANLGTAMVAVLGPQGGSASDSSVHDTVNFFANPPIDAQAIPGLAIPEIITITLIDATSFGVTSSVANGTGTGGDNTGYVNQTYIDKETSFRVTIPNGTDSQSGPFSITYQAGDIIRYTITPNLTTYTSQPELEIPGLKLVVKSTAGGNVGDTAFVNTYNLDSASEPAVGDFYYISYTDLKTFDSNGLLPPVLYTNEKDVFAATGPLAITNKLAFAAHLAFLNGAAAVALLEIEAFPQSDGADAPSSEYIAGIDAFNEPLPGGFRPTLMEPLIAVGTTTGTAVINYLKTSNVIQSGIRYGNEHVSYFGFALETTPTQAQIYAKATATERMIAVYPDGAVTTLTDALGNTTEYLVDGSLLAAAVAGRDVSPAFDVAEPITKKPIVGFTRLFRRLDSVTSALTANAGITLLEESGAGIDVKFGLTTDLTSVLTRTPSVIRTKDFVQRGVRSILAPYIGTKLLIQRISQIENTVTSYLAGLQQAQIIQGFNNVSAVQDPNDPTIINVTAFYAPILPLLYIVVTFNLRSSV